ncbi:MAG: hypothetical protein MRY81_03485 [Donghicola eburneus]|nr:hypothetical protein [Donghicola eburneus]MCI5038725.1 hypothetical protein [Donghicola eburneus]
MPKKTAAKQTRATKSKETRTAKPKRPLREGTKIVQVAYNATTSGAEARADITMPLAPWETAA